MAYPNPSPHLKMQWSGTIGRGAAPNEIWSFGISAAGTIGSGPWLALSVTQLAALASSLSAAWAPFAAGISSAVLLTRTRVATIGNDGLVMRTEEGAYRQGDNFTVRPGTGTHLGHAPQIAQAVSLRSTFAGPTGRGRFFVPLPAAGTDTADMLITEAARDAAAARAQAFIQSINTTLNGTDVGLRVVIASGGSLVKGLTPTVHTVTQVGVGKALDTIRTRRNALPEVMEYLTV